jgi:hypothetical protein
VHVGANVNLREWIGGAIAILAVFGLAVVAVLEAMNQHPFDTPPALAAIAGAAVGTYMSNAGSSSTAEKMTNGFLGAVQQVQNVQNTANDKPPIVPPLAPPPVHAPAV